MTVHGVLVPLVVAAALQAPDSVGAGTDPEAPAGPEVRIQVPEVYELANITLALHPYAREQRSLALRRDPFTPLSPAMEDFARKSDYRAFYRENAGYYRDMVGRYGELVEIRAMAGWLEREFPRTRIDRYTVVLSPLVYGSHSTRTVEGDGGKEAVMFVAGPDLPVDDDPPGLRKAANERLVFTEIDHNYVNPETDRHRRRVRSVFGPDPASWNRDPAGHYGSAVGTFNEYMTWSVFLLYADDTYTEEVARAIRDQVVGQMEDTRGFLRFGLFHRKLAALYRSREPGETVADLYPDLLDALGSGG